MDFTNELAFKYAICHFGEQRNFYNFAYFNTISYETRYYFRQHYNKCVKNFCLNFDKSAQILNPKESEIEYASRSCEMSSDIHLIGSDSAFIQQDLDSCIMGPI